MKKERIYKDLPEKSQLTSYAGGFSAPLKRGHAVPSALTTPQLEVYPRKWRMLCAFVAGYTPYSTSSHFLMQPKKPLLTHFYQLNIRNIEGGL